MPAVGGKAKERSEALEVCGWRAILYLPGDNMPTSLLARWHLEGLRQRPASLSRLSTCMDEVTQVLCKATGYWQVRMIPPRKRLPLLPTVDCMSFR